MPRVVMRQWVFEEALGRYEIDLGDSHVDCHAADEVDLGHPLRLEYGVDRGSHELRDLIADLYGRSRNEVVVTHGSQEALYLLYRTLLHPGDEAVAFAPGWPPSWEVPALCGSTVRLLTYGESLQLDVATVRGAISARTRVITLNTPGNPTGKRIDPETLQAIVDLASDAGIHVVADEEYLT